MYTPLNLKRWVWPECYMGAKWPEYYGAGGRSRDSDALERANFDAMLALLGGESETVLVVREFHWAVGWVEWIAVHESDEAALRAADRAKARLEDYPVLDEERWSQYEDEECSEVWEHCFGERERADYLREHVSTVYPMSGETAYGMLRAAVKGSWYHAANLLPCPSDLLA